MRFFNPQYIWLLLGLIPLALLFLYTVRLPQMTIDSLFLVKRLIARKRIRQTARTGKHSRNLFVLQLFVVCCAVAALTAPVIVRHIQNSDIVLLVDTSVSMNTTADGRPRFDYAVDQARKIIASLSPGQKIVLGSFNDSLELHTQPTNNRDILESYLDQITVKQVAGRFTGQYLEVVRSTIVPSLHNPTLIILTDHLPETLQDTADCRFSLFTASDGNAGITAISQIFLPNGRSQITATIRSDSKKTLFVPVTVYDGNRQLYRTATTLEPYGEQSVSFAVNRAQIQDGHITIRLDMDDALEEDNAASIPLKKPVTVVISGTSAQLEKAVFSYPPAERIASENITPDVLISVNQPGGGTDDVQFIVAPTAGTASIAVGERVRTDAPITVIKPDHPILRDVSLHGIRVASAHRIQPADKATVLATAGSLPVLWCVESGMSRTVILNFSPEATGLDRRISFPILVGNIIDWITAQDVSDDIRRNVLDRYETAPREPVEEYTRPEIIPNISLTPFLLAVTAILFVTEGIMFYGTKQRGRQ